MTKEEHRQRHLWLHQQFDELLADYMRHHRSERGFLQMPVGDLMKWSHEQTIEPTPLENEHQDE